MRVCILNATRTLGGTSVIAYDLARGLVARGHDVLFVCAGEEAGTINSGPYPIEILPTGNLRIYHYANPILVERLRRVLIRFEPDVVHIHNINLRTFSLTALLLSRWYPLVWTLHDLWPLCLTGWPDPPDCRGMLDHCRHCPTWAGPMARLNRLLKETTYRHIDLSVVTPCRWLARMLRDSDSQLSQQPGYIVPNGIDSELFRPLAEPGYGGPSREDSASWKRAKDIPVEKRLLLFSGGRRLAGRAPNERKGWSDLIDALHQLANARDDIHLLYAGDPVPVPRELERHVTFLEGINHEDMPFCYRASEAFVLPTLADNVSLTVLEAMACGVPVISTYTGGIPEIITNGTSGYLCPARNPSALAATIEHVLSDSQTAARVAQNGRECILRRYTRDAMIEGYIEVYRETRGRRH
jgi:glycosyltransferase involved in cell wall biosynthesis